MITTFINCSQSDTKQFKAKALSYLKSRKQDFKGYMKHGYYRDEAITKVAIKFFEDMGDFNEYGLSFSRNEPEDNEEIYYQYQLSWGGPSDEIRFYTSGGIKGVYRIEYVYMDWGTGIGFDITNEDWVKWVLDQFQDYFELTHCEY